ncbi:hypothetical protein CTRI78_v010498 [Colletotrichum trifolii]|uniref:Uncharacterized protein n=1 Tax=Colletotrichum trifolii TaxID=5466 RepID=A0A4R8QSS7_COLTR|nr:hypothetical protein CTRI78_v010498 [Colletotrichum trifolii]
MATQTQTATEPEAKHTYAAQFETKDLVTFDTTKQYGAWRDEIHIRPTQQKPKRDAEVCPKYRTEPFEKPDLTDRLLQLAGVKPY